MPVNTLMGYDHHTYSYPLPSLIEKLVIPDFQAEEIDELKVMLMDLEKEMMILKAENERLKKELEIAKNPEKERLVGRIALYTNIAGHRSTAYVLSVDSKKVASLRLVTGLPQDTIIKNISHDNAQSKNTWCLMFLRGKRA